MVPKKFKYYAPETLNEAINLLNENEDAKILAGGQSLLALMKLRLAGPPVLVDVQKLSLDFSYVRVQGDLLAIGALTTHDTVERNQTIKDKFAILNDAVIKIGDQQIRNIGTIGGSACHGDPAADLPVVLLALNAEIVLVGKTGQRIVSARNFFVDVFTTAVKRDEILTEIRLPFLPPRSGSSCIKHSLRESDFAIMIAGTVLTLGEDTVCKEARICIAPAGPTPIRANSAEQYLRGKTLDEKIISEAAEKATEGADPPSDINGSRGYRLEMIKVLTRRSLELALSRIKE
jgi:aerobic carbon-monoxide dehydrogenase medium subunit